MPVDSQKQGRAMSGGQRIDDHSFWAGGPGKDMVMPQGAHTKNESSAEGAGSLLKYEDTTERIKHAQKEAVKQVKGHQGRLPVYRN
jgi:hypothetical protein